MSALDALSAARAAGVKLTLDGDGVVLSTKRPPLPVDLVALLKANKPDIMKILEWREAAREALSAAPPSDCAEQFAPRVYGVRKPMWDLVQDGLRRFCAQGWGDKACLLGWTKDELYRVPSLWARVDLC